MHNTPSQNEQQWYQNDIPSDKIHNTHNENKFLFKKPIGSGYTRTSNLEKCAAKRSKTLDAISSSPIEDVALSVAKCSSSAMTIPKKRVALCVVKNLIQKVTRS